MKIKVSDTNGILKHTNLGSSPWQQIQMGKVGYTKIAKLHPSTPPTLLVLVAASSGLDGYIKLWDLETGKLLKSIDGGPGKK